MAQNDVESSRVAGGWVVARVQNQDGVRSLSLSFFPEPEPDLDDDQPWPTDPSISSTTTRVTRRPR